ncbi:MAG: hypothetical protein LBN34_03795 [Clostridiales Family XIII bacterium]|jgi:uncharacterized alkaline shock family protein YloU|nr:hypothetical protein [Clostridiales Family XIII bacterium]
MFYKRKTEIGSIAFDKQLLEFVVARTVSSFESAVIVSDPKGRLKKDADKNPYAETGFIDGFVNENDHIDLKVYLIIRFGHSMNEIAAEFSKRVRTDVFETIGMHIDDVTLIFVGTLSKNLAKRYIEVKDSAQ